MQLSKKKRGRPRQNRPGIDHGTQELQHKRAMLFKEVLGTNPALAESLLGIFYGKQLISTPLYKAGVCFGELAYRYEPCMGHKFRPYSSPLLYKTMEGRGDSPDQWLDDAHEKRTMAWRKALLALKTAGREPYTTVMKVVFYDQDLYHTPFPKKMINYVPSLRIGLKSLDAYFKGELPSRRGKPHDLDESPGQSTIFQPASKESPPDLLALRHGRVHPLPSRGKWEWTIDQRIHGDR